MWQLKQKTPREKDVWILSDRNLTRNRCFQNLTIFKWLASSYISLIEYGNTDGNSALFYWPTWIPVQCGSGWHLFKIYWKVSFECVILKVMFFLIVTDIWHLSLRNIRENANYLLHSVLLFTVYNKERGVTHVVVSKKILYCNITVRFVFSLLLIVVYKGDLAPGCEGRGELIMMSPQWEHQPPDKTGATVTLLFLEYCLGISLS